MPNSLLIDDEFHKLIPPLEEEEYSGLEQSIIKYGNIVPITIWEGHNIIVDGHNRYNLCIKHGKELKKPFIEFPFPDRESVKIWIIDNQLARRNLAPAIKIELNIVRYELIEQQKARERKEEAGELYHKGSPKVTQTFGEPLDKKHEGEVDKLIGEKAGVSRETVRKYRQVQAKATLEQKDKLRHGNATINEVYVEIRREKVKQDIRQTPVWPTGKYRVIYADPPWRYGNAASIELVEQADHYPTKTVDEIIKQYPVQNITLDNTVLFMWATSPILEESFKVINAWGFKYKASFVWDKVKHNMGHYNSVRHEFLLIAVRGSCQPDIPELIDSVQVIERGEHSEKPEEFRKIIDTLYPYGPRIELFARKEVLGWDNYGNQITATVPE